MNKTLQRKWWDLFVRHWKRIQLWLYSICVNDTPLNFFQTKKIPKRKTLSDGSDFEEAGKIMVFEAMKISNSITKIFLSFHFFYSYQKCEEFDNKSFGKRILLSTKDWNFSKEETSLFWKPKNTANPLSLVTELEQISSTSMWILEDWNLQKTCLQLMSLNLKARKEEWNETNFLFEILTKKKNKPPKNKRCDLFYCFLIILWLKFLFSSSTKWFFFIQQFVWSSRRQ